MVSTLLCCKVVTLQCLLHKLNIEMVLMDMIFWMSINILRASQWLKVLGFFSAIRTNRCNIFKFFEMLPLWNKVTDVTQKLYRSRFFIVQCMCKNSKAQTDKRMWFQKWSICILQIPKREDLMWYQKLFQNYYTNFLVRK